MKRAPKKKAKPAAKAPAKTPARGRSRHAKGGDRLNRTQMAERLKVDRKTISKYLAMDGAPKPDKAVRYSVDEVRAWIERVAVRLPNTSEEYKELTLAIKRMEKEDMELDLRQRRGELVEKKTIEPTIASVMALLTENLRNVFEGELPNNYEGKTTAERAALNAAGVDRVLDQFKAGLAALT